MLILCVCYEMKNELAATYPLRLMSRSWYFNSKRFF